MQSVSNEAPSPLTLYVVHADDVGNPVTTVRVVATITLAKGEKLTIEEFRDYLDSSGCHFHAALVIRSGTLVFSDPRKFQ